MPTLVGPDGEKYEVSDRIYEMLQEKRVEEKPPLPPDLARAVELGFITEEQARIAAGEDNADVPAEIIVQNASTQLEPPIEPLPPCKQSRDGGHRPVRYFLVDGNRVDGQCKCGQMLENVKCPHQHQRYNKGRKRVECEWCGKVLIGNAGVVEAPPGSAQQWYEQGFEAKVPAPDHFRGDA